MLARQKSGFLRRLKIFLGLIFLASTLAGIIYLIWFSRVFQIQAIEVQGGTPAQEELLKQKKMNNLLFWQPPLRVKDFPQIARLEFKRDFINRKIVVNLEERQKILIWCLEKIQNCFWVDQTGFAFSDAPFPTGSLVVKVIRDHSERELKIGENVLPPDEFSHLQEVLQLLDELNLPVDQVKIENINYREIVADLISGPDIYFSLLFSPEFGKSVIEKLRAAGGWSGFRYLDLRVENRAYYSL